MSKKISEEKSVTSDTVIEVKESIPTPSGKELMMDKAVNEAKSEADNLLEQSRSTASELRGLIEQNKKILDEMKILRAEELLKGRSEAGQTKVEVPETATEYARRICAGRSSR